jgi:two-component system copper resistance phosphate regulon response regulator CusR
MTPLKVLIVDDDAALSQLIGRILTKSGRYVTHVENNPHAVNDVARQFQPDVILLDVDMPAKDGGSVLRDLRKSPQFSRTPAAFLTSLVSVRETNNGLSQRGNAHYIAKTLDVSVLDRGIQQLIGLQAA